MMTAVEFAATILMGGVAPTDCEAVHDGLVRQPVNAYSSLAFLVVGVWILARAARQEPGARGELATFGAGMVGVGLGSVLLHGPAPGWALWFHDLSGLAVLLLVAILNLGVVLGWSFRGPLLVVAAGLVLLALQLAAVPTSTVPVAFVLAPAAGLAQVWVIFRGLRPGFLMEPSSRTLAWLIAVLALALAGGAFLLGRSGSPLCHPRSVVQLHAVWHVLVAVSAGAFAIVAFEPNPRLEAEQLGRSNSSV